MSADRPRRWDECSGDPCICPKPARLFDAERQSLAYAFLADRTSHVAREIRAAIAGQP